MKVRATPKLIGYLAIWALSLLPAFLSGGLAGWLPFCTLGLCGLLSLLQLLWLRGRLEHAVSAKEGALMRGGALELELQVRDRSIVPAVRVRAEFFVSGEQGTDGHVYPLDLSLAPGETRSVRFQVDFPHIGIYRAGLRQVVVWDLLGTFKAVGRRGEEQRLEVQPRVPKLDRLPVSTLQIVENQRAAAPSPLSGMDYTGVREYAYGDPIKTIQWKLSAHAGALMTKLMESYTNTGVSIVLDLQVPDYGEQVRLDLLDGLVETAAAVGDYAAREGMDYELLYVSPEGEERRCTPASFRDLRLYLPEFCLRPCGQADGTARLLEAGGSGPHSQSNVVLCAARLDQELIEVLLRLRRGRKNVCVCYFLPDSVYDIRRQELLAPLRQLEGAGVACVTANSAEGMVARI